MRFRLLLILIFFLSFTPSFGQVERPLRSPADVLRGQKQGLPPDTLAVKSDTSKIRTDSLARKSKSEIETTITYSAMDSINSRVDRKIVHLYGDAKIQYGVIQLMAEEIVIDYEKSTIYASGKLDSLGRRVGYPIFVNGSEKYETKSIVYNFKNKKAHISEVVTTQGDGFLHGNAVFKNDKNELLSIRNAYTTCNLAHPHYQIMASRAKAIPGDKMVVGPFHMEFNDVPLPLGFAFGIFPSPRSSASGIIVPSYGEENNRGFFLRRGGYFFDINDYFKLNLTGDIYSKGSWAVFTDINYRKRYRYSGAFNFSVTNNLGSEQRIEDRTISRDFRLTWSHAPQTRGTGRFSASVNAATNSYLNNNFVGYAAPTSTSLRPDQTTRKLSSNISFSKTFGSKFSFGTNFRINQDLTTKQVDLPFPDLTFNINNLYPFKKVSEGLFLENLSVRYSMSATNQITNNLGRNWTDLSGSPIKHDSIAPFNAENIPAFFRNAKKGIRHNIPAGTSFKVANFFTVSPGVSLDELWYFEKLNWKLSDDSTRAEVKDTVRQFNRVTNYSTSVSITTRIYGTYFFKRKSGAGIQAIRHVINPSIAFSYQPDFGDPSHGYIQKLQLKNNPYPVYKSVHEGFVYGSSRVGESATMSFGVNNNIEMKVRSKKDTASKKVSLFNTLSIGSGYNFRADSFKLSPFSLAANTNVLQDKLNINMSASLDPYKYVTLVSDENPSTVKELRTRYYAWNSYRAPAGYYVRKDGFGIGRITNASLALGTNLNAKGQKKDTDTKSKIAKSNISDSDKKYLLQNPDTYIDFNIPWNLRVNYNIDYAHSTNTVPAVTQAMRFNGDFSLTRNWKITFNSGYDFEQKEITQTYLTIARDLHCWQVNLSWVPFGKYQSYTFYIGIKSSILKDLRLNRTRSFFDN